MTARIIDIDEAREPVGLTRDDASAIRDAEVIAKRIYRAAQPCSWPKRNELNDAFVCIHALKRRIAELEKGTAAELHRLADTLTTQAAE